MKKPRECVLSVYGNSEKNAIGSTAVQYRLYKDGDFTALYAIEEASFEPPFRFDRNYLRNLIASPQTATWVAEEDGTAAGFAIVTTGEEAEQTVAYLETIEVSPLWRGRGVGGELLRRVEGSAQAAGAAVLWLHVDAENAAAIRLYEAQGYVRSGEERDFYPRGRTALVYLKLDLQSRGSSLYA